MRWDCAVVFCSAVGLYAVGPNHLRHLVSQAPRKGDGVVDHGTGVPLDSSTWRSHQANEPNHGRSSTRPLECVQEIPPITAPKMEFRNKIQKRAVTAKVRE